MLTEKEIKMESNNKKKLILIGGGKRGNTYTKLGKELDKFELIAVAEPIKIRREYIAKLHGIPENMCFESWEPLLELGKIADVAVIATMDRDHYAPTMKAIDLGYDILLEKPVSPVPEECEEIEAAAEAKGVQVLVCHVSDMIVSVFDADTLEHIETRRMERGGSSITYLPETDEYLLGSQLFKCVKAKDFSDAGDRFEAHPDTRGLTTQGIASDKDHVYSLLCKGLGHAKYNSFVAVYDHKGNYESLISFKVEDGYEPENISIVDGEMYVMCCSPQPVTTFYKVTPID